MEEFKLYSVSDRYIEYLRKVFPNVYSNKGNYENPYSKVCRHSGMSGKLSLLYGIRVTMFYDGHNPPRFYAEYNGNKAVIETDKALVQCSMILWHGILCILLLAYTTTFDYNVP